MFLEFQHEADVIAHDVKELKYIIYQVIQNVPSLELINGILRRHGGFEEFVDDAEEPYSDSEEEGEEAGTADQSDDDEDMEDEFDGSDEDMEEYEASPSPQPEEEQLVYPEFYAPHWPSALEFSMTSNSDEFFALLASPFGASAIWLLLQHRVQLGNKRVKSVRLWKDIRGKMALGETELDEPWPSLLIEFEDFE